MPNLTIIAPAVLTAGIALFVYLYTNKIGFSVTTITGDIVNGNDQIKLLQTYGHIQAERINLKSYGFRTLENVELHLATGTKPASVSVRDSSSMSTKSIKTEWDDCILTISIPSMPRNEEINIDIIRVGHYEPVTDRLRGTGGKYKIVRKEYQELKSNFINSLSWGILGFVVAVVGMVLDNQQANKRTTPPVVAGQAK